ncbi:hypothetical protein HBI83_020360 [Parastagonospora nodorum]|nr:hypothetical protein HBI83_020360 [Parastagonospora nodorum]
MNSNMYSHNLYALLADLNIDEEEDHKTVTFTSDRVSVNDTHAIHEDEEAEYDDEDDIIHALFDLEALGGHAGQPTFTRGLLQKVASDIRSISTIQKGLNRERENSLYWKGSNGPSARIWKEVDGANDVTVNYMTRVEMSSQFQTLFGNDWKRSKPLRALNTNLSQHQLNELAAPYYLESFRRAADNTHLDAEKMNWWRDRLCHTQNLWENSSSCIQLCRIVRQGAARLRAPIAKIVCIGLGELDSSPAFYQSAIQHMTAFSFAEALDAFNRTAHPECPPVTIIAQDPCYKACDRILLQELTNTLIDFSLSDPETLLSIHANTLVITAFLPHTVPLMQILADLFAGEPEKGPAMILGDRIVNPGGRTKWCFRNRDQPGVAKFLMGGYTLWPTEFVGVDGELRKDLSGWRKSWEYWLGKMMFCLRRDGGEVKKA